MAVLKNGAIILNSPRLVFYPGQKVAGSLEIEIESPLTFSVIYVTILGEGTVEWEEEETEAINGRKRYKTINYVGTEEYFKGSLLMTGSHGSITNLDPGKYSYPFEFMLPYGIPSSFSGDRGAVVYSVKGFVELQTQRLYEDDFIKFFDVVSPLDLNNGKPCVKEPIEMEFEEMYGCCGCFCNSGPVSVRVRLPVSGYCPGQNIPVSVAVDNKSNVEITNMVFEILTRQRYRAQRPAAEYVPPEEVLATVKKGSIMSGNTKNFIVDLTVPDFIVPNLEECGIIDVGYFFKTTIQLSGCNDNMQDEAEICLGLVPLQETVDGTYEHPMAHSLPIGHIPEATECRIYMPDPHEACCFVQANGQVISDPAKNQVMGFRPPPGSRVQPIFSDHYPPFSDMWRPVEDSMRMKMDNLMKDHVSYPTRGGYVWKSNVVRNAGTESLKSPVPTAPPM